MFFMLNPPLVPGSSDISILPQNGKKVQKNQRFSRLSQAFQGAYYTNFLGGDGRIALGCSTLSPCMSQVNCSQVNLCTSAAVRGHWYLPLDNCLLNRMKPSGSHSNAFSWLRLLPQNSKKVQKNQRFSGLSQAFQGCIIPAFWAVMDVLLWAVPH